MLRLRQSIIVQLFLTSLIGFVSYIGDKGLQNGKTEIVRAISDNLTHATVGGIAWALVIVLSKQKICDNLLSIVLCFSMASLIDIDHFIAAGSWDINDATHLHYRPFFHNTSLPIMLWIIMYTAAKLFNDSNWIIYGWMMIVSFITHQVRDANRRGLWFWPIGSTKPIPYKGYLFICMILPYTVNWIMEWQLKDKDVDRLPFVV